MTDGTRFAHASEAELARILDYYGVRWEYEPRTFPILWNLDGKVVESFSPDFYLPDMDLYVELTTLKQSLVRRKNRKLRRLRELYPDIRVKLFYGKDFRALMLKYGRFDLAASLSGLEGQITPDRRAPAISISVPLTAPTVQVQRAVVQPDPAQTHAPASASTSANTRDAYPAPELAESPVRNTLEPATRWPFAALRRRLSRSGRRRRGRRAFIGADRT